MHNIGTVPTFKMHNIGTVPMFKMHNVGTPKIYDLCLSWNWDCIIRGILEKQSGAEMCQAQHSLLKLSTGY